jgi:tetratricopeptide (TPR) repeat protein
VTAAQRRIQRLQRLHSIAPRAVAARAAQELADNPRLLRPDKRRLVSLQTLGALTTDASYSCHFPVVFPQDDPRCDGIEGGVLRVCCTPSGLNAPLGAGSAAAAFSDDRPLHTLIEGWQGEGLKLQLMPRPGQAHTDLLGDSAGAALALAVEAARRQRALHHDVVISAAVRATDAGLVLGPVGHTIAKARMLAAERPGCRFLVLSRPGEDPRQVPGLRVEFLEPGSIAPLLDRLLGTAPRLELVQPRQALLALLDDASGRFRAQRYEQAEPLYSEALERLEGMQGDRDSALWRYQVELRLAAIRLHRGHGPDTSPAFQRLARQRPEGHCDYSDALEVEELSSAAGIHIDRFEPARAREALDLLSWVEHTRARGENRQMLLAYHGTTTQLRLLEGDHQAALASQQRVVDASPDHELARSLCNLGEGFQRAGHHDAASRTWARAQEALQHVEDYYRHHTRAFLVYLVGRAALLAGDPDGAGWKGRAEGALTPLEPSAAAAWRLASLVDLARLVAGDHAALNDMIERTQLEHRDFVRWHLALELLRAGHLAPTLSGRAHSAAAAVLTDLPKPDHPPLEQARTGFCESAQRGVVGPGVVERILTFRAY